MTLLYNCIHELIMCVFTTLKSKICDGQSFWHHHNIFISANGKQLQVVTWPDDIMWQQGEVNSWKPSSRLWVGHRRQMWIPSSPWTFHLCQSVYLLKIEISDKDDIWCLNSVLLLVIYWGYMYWVFFKPDINLTECFTYICVMISSQLCTVLKIKMFKIIYGEHYNI